MAVPAAGEAAYDLEANLYVVGDGLSEAEDLDYAGTFSTALPEGEGTVALRSDENFVIPEVLSTVEQVSRTIMNLARQLRGEPPMANQWKRATAAAWTAANTVLADGEPGYEKDTGKFKIGNGVSGWNARPYAVSTDPEVVRDTIGQALLQGGYINVTVNDAGDTITLAVDAEALQDMLATFFQPGVGLVETYDDAGNHLGYAVAVPNKLLEAGAAVPPGTEPNTLIFRKA